MEGRKQRSVFVKIALNKVEDENHFLFECGMHVTERKELYNMIKAKINVDIPHIPSHPEKIQEISTLKI